MQNPVLDVVDGIHGRFFLNISIYNTVYFTTSNIEFNFGLQAAGALGTRFNSSNK